MSTSLIEFNAAQAAEADVRHEPVVRLYRQGQTYREIADVTGLSFQRIGQIIQRARKRGLLE